MLRITELRLPLDHAPDALATAIAAKLKIDASALERFAVVKRGHDARKKPKIFYVYTMDAAVEDEAAILARLTDTNVKPRARHGL